MKLICIITQLIFANMYLVYGQFDTKIKFLQPCSEKFITRSKCPNNFSMMTTISFNSVPSSDPYSIVGPNPAIDRIKTVIDSIKTYGVDSKYIFSVDDLHEAKHIPLVVRCLEEIEKMV